MTPPELSRDALARVRGVLFDLDGTLYHQKPVQRRMALALLALPLRTLSPGRTRRVIRRISAYRKLHEDMRALGHASESLAELQLARAAERTGDDLEEVRATIDEWMIRRPLPAVRAARRRDLMPLLDFLRTRSLQLGVLSDYPVEQKLEALEVRERFSLALCSSDPEINALKPNPRGIRHACERWGLPAEQVLYVGDRVEVDGAAAVAAGAPCAILDGSGTEAWAFDSMAALQRAMEAAR